MSRFLGPSRLFEENSGESGSFWLGILSRLSQTSFSGPRCSQSQFSSLSSSLQFVSTRCWKTLGTRLRLVIQTRWVHICLQGKFWCIQKPTWLCPQRCSVKRSLKTHLGQSIVNFKIKSRVDAKSDETKLAQSQINIRIHY